MTEKYQKLVTHIADSLLAVEGKPLDAVAAACDVLADVIWKQFDNDELRLAAVDIAITRLGNVLDRRAARMN